MQIIRWNGTGIISWQESFEQCISRICFRDSARPVFWDIRAVLAGLVNRMASPDVLTVDTAASGP